MKNNNWQLKDKCVMKKKRLPVNNTDFVYEYEFFRAEVISFNEITKKYKIFLLDAGIYEENVCENALLKIIDEFSTKPEFKAKRCYIGGVEPMGTVNGVWSTQAKQYTNETLNGRHVHVVFDWEKRNNNESKEIFEVN